MHLYHSSSPWLEKFWKPIPLDAPWMTNFDDIHFHHGWRKFWNPMPLQMRRMTNLNIVYLHHYLRKFWNSMSIDAPRMTNFDKFIFILIEANFEIPFALMRFEWRRLYLTHKPKHLNFSLLTFTGYPLKTLKALFITVFDNLLMTIEESD